MAAADAAAVGRSEGGEGGGLAAGVSIQYLRQRLKALQLANSSTSSASSSLHSSSIAPSSFSSSSSSSSSSSWSRGVAREESLEEMQKRKMVGADEALHRWRREGKILEGGMSRIDLDSLRVRKTNDRAEEKEKEEEQKRNDQQLNKVSGLSNPMVKANDNDSIDSGFLFRMRNREEDAKKNSEMGSKPCQNGRINKEEVGLIDSMDEPYSSRLNLSFRRMKNGEEEEKKSSEMGPEPHQNGRNDKHADPSDSMDKPCNSSPDFRFCRMKNGEEEDEKKNTEVGSKPCKYAQINKEVGLSNSMEPPLNSSLDFGYCLRKNREAEVEKILGLKPYRYGLLNKDSSSINLTEKTGDGSVDSRCPRKVKNGEEVEKKNLEMGLKPYQNGRLNKEAGPSNLPEKPFDGSLSSGCSQVHRMKNREEDVKQRSVMGSKTCQNGLLSKDSSYTNLTEKTDNSSIDSRFLCQMKNEDEELAKGWKRYQNVILKKDLSLSNPTERPDDSNIDSGFLCQMKNREVDERKDKPYQNGQINKEAYPSDSMEKPFNSNLDSGYSRVNRTKSREEDVKQSSEIGSKPHWNGLLIKDLGLNNPMERLYNSSLDYGCSRVNGTNSREGNEKQKSVVKALNPYRNGLLNKDSTLSPLEEEPDSSGPDSGTKNGEEEEDEKQTSPKPYGNGFLGRGTSLNNPAEPKEVPQLSRSSLMNSSSRFSCEETKKNPQRLAQPLNYYSSFDRSKAVENSSYPIKSTMEADEDDNVEESDSVNLPKSGLNHNGLKSRILTEPNVAQLTPLTPALSTLSTANPYQIKSVNEEKGLVSSEMVGESSYKEEEDKEEELKGGVKLPKSAPGRAIMGVSSLSRSNHNVVGSIGGSVSKQSVVLQTTPSTPALPVLASVLTPQLRLPRQFTFSQSKPNKPNLSALRVLVESDINEEKNADTKHSAAIGGKCNSKEAAVDGAPAVLKKTVPAVLSNLTNMAKNEPPRMKSVLMKRPASNYECANGEKENMIEGRHSIATRLHNEKGGGNSSKKYSHAEDRKATVKLGSAMLTTTELTPNVSLNLVEKSHVSMGQGEGNNKSMVASTCSSDIAPTMGASSVVETQSNNNTSECNFAPKMPHLLPTAPCSMTFRSTSAPPLSYTSSQDIPKMAEKEAKRSKQEFPQENEEKNVPLAKVEKAPLHQPTTTHRKQRWETEHCVWVNGKRYQKLGKIGSGGSSEVYKVIASDCTIYALKRIQLKGRDYSSACGFYQEISYLEKLRGRNNIIQMIDYEVTDKSVFHLENGPSRIKTDVFIYMVLEYGEIDLAHMLSDKWKERSQTGEELDENWLRLYWQQILKAVNTIHEERIVHSDLKPANFLLVKGMLKLIDFGIAKAIQNEDTTNIVRESQVGTVNYMAPEAFLTNQVDDENGKIFKCGRSSDIWSLGCILYQMVYGCTPFSHVTHLWAKVTEISNRQHKINFPPISNPDIIDIMKRCLTWNREERPRIPQLLEHPFLRPTSRYASHQFHLHKTEMKNHLSKETAYNQAPEVQTVVSQDLGD